MHFTLAALAGALLLGSAPATAELVKLKLGRGAELRIAIEPARGNAAAYALLFAGGHGKIDLDEAGEPRGLRGNFLIRARGHLRAQGVGVVLVDAASDQQGAEGLWPYRLSAAHAADVGQAVRLMRQRYGRPVWLVGTSAGTLSVANAMARLIGPERPDGVVYTASVTRPTRRRPATVFDANLASYAGPALVISHETDGCVATPAADAPRLIAALAGARPKKLEIVAGGLPPRSDPCEAHSQHGFFGIEAQVMGMIAAFILRGGG
jgi:hypothetical protein